MKLAAKTLTIQSQVLRREVKAIIPEAKIFMRRHVPAVGYVLYVKDFAGKTIGYVTKDLSGLTLIVKAA